MRLSVPSSGPPARFRLLILAAALLAALLIMPSSAVAHLQGESATVSLTATVTGRSSGQATEPDHITGPGYWQFTLREFTSRVREVTISIRDGCEGTEVYTQVLPGASGDLADYLNTAIPSFSALPASWEVNPAGYCLRLDVKAKGGKGVATATADVTHPHDRYGTGETAWAYLSPTSYRQLHGDGITLNLEGFAVDQDGQDLGDQLVWTSNTQGPLGIGPSIWPKLNIGAHTISAVIGSRSDSLSFTVVGVGVTVDVDPGPYQNRDSVLIQVAVTRNDPPPIGPIAGLEVDVDVFTPNGGWLTYRSTTDADGVATIQHVVDTRADGAGTYDVRARAYVVDQTWVPTEEGYGSATSSFEVQAKGKKPR